MENVEQRQVSDAYECLVQGGWTGISGSQKYGGMGTIYVMIALMNILVVHVFHFHYCF